MDLQGRLLRKLSEKVVSSLIQMCIRSDPAGVDYFGRFMRVDPEVIENWHNLRPKELICGGPEVPAITAFASGVRDLRVCRLRGRPVHEELGSMHVPGFEWHGRLAIRKAHPCVW